MEKGQAYDSYPPTEPIRDIYTIFPPCSIPQPWSPIAGLRFLPTWTDSGRCSALSALNWHGSDPTFFSSTSKTAAIREEMLNRSEIFANNALYQMVIEAPETGPILLDCKGPMPL
ncbi:hypothetical protein KC19_8G063700 [Ceratodon purpureus]|uniref:Uncharacterized protein n=1 Tax=Ceratodon purpureus TaxID=3225 RepID=A0A8T0GY93_CERPU|nr:hypothetical protein KC19_8G063700 [Ceratodon purpureus]